MGGKLGKLVDVILWRKHLKTRITDLELQISELRTVLVTKTERLAKLEAMHKRMTAENIDQQNTIEAIHNLMSKT